MSTTVYKEWMHPGGHLRTMHMPVEIQRLNKTITNHEGVELIGFWMPNNYATGPNLCQFYLVEAALDALELAQIAVVEEGGSLLLTDAWRSMEQQAEAYKNKKGIAVSPSQSNHPKGIAIDVTPHDLTQERMEEILAAYGWARTVPHEPWHFDYKGELY